MNKLINNLIDRIVDLEIENKRLIKSECNYGSKLSAADDYISKLKLEITNLKLILDELQKEKGNN